MVAPPAAMAAAASQSWNWKSTSVGVLHVLILDSGKSQLDAACAGDCRRTAEMHSLVHLKDGLKILWGQIRSIETILAQILA